MTTQSNKGISEAMRNSEYHQLFLKELKDIYWAEKHLVKSLPKMSEAATSKKLVDAISSHLNETKEHVSRLERVFELLEEKSQAIKCEAMEGLLEEAKEILEDSKAETAVRDAGIIIACQKVEHYEIASYGSLVEMAQKMDHRECADILAETLEDEKKADELLNKLAKSEINVKALEV